MTANESIYLPLKIYIFVFAKCFRYYLCSHWNQRRTTWSRKWTSQRNLSLIDSLRINLREKRKKKAGIEKCIQLLSEFIRVITKLLIWLQHRLLHLIFLWRFLIFLSSFFIYVTLWLFISSASFQSLCVHAFRFLWIYRTCYEVEETTTITKIIGLRPFERLFL